VRARQHLEAGLCAVRVGTPLSVPHQQQPRVGKRGFLRV
jgi:hypothetical protein